MRWLPNGIKVGHAFRELKEGPGLDYGLFAGTLAAIGVAALTFTNTTNRLMQFATEPAMWGRVMALRVAIAPGGTPIGAPMAGWVANHMGPRQAVGVGAALGVAAPPWPRTPWCDGFIGRDGCRVLGT